MPHGSGLENGGDPGWGPVLRPMVWLLIPGVGFVLFRKYQLNHPTHGLTLLRVLFTAFTNALVLIGAVIAVLVNVAHFRGGTLSAFPIAIGVTVIGVAGLAARQLFDRRLDCSDDLRLATTYRERFFLRIAFSEAASLAGFAAFILTSRWWLYPLGAVFTAVGYTAPGAHWRSPQPRSTRLDRGRVRSIAYCRPCRATGRGRFRRQAHDCVTVRRSGFLICFKLDLVDQLVHEIVLLIAVDCPFTGLAEGFVEFVAKGLPFTGQLVDPRG